MMVFVFFGYAVHWFAQCVLSVTDVGGVRQALASLEEAMDKEEVLRLFEELRATPPEILVTAEACRSEPEGASASKYHTVRAGVDRIDFCETLPFLFSSWSDVSGKLLGLDQYRLVSIAVVPDFICADEETEQSLRELEHVLADACRRHGASMRLSQSVCLPHPRYPVACRRVFVARSQGAGSPWWLSSDVYALGRFVCPFFGVVYRWLFHIQVTAVRYKLTKHISVLASSHF